MTVKAPPTNKPITEENGGLSMPWLTFFNQTYNGDAGTSWTPTFVSLTEAGGSATITGRYYRISQFLIFFNILITPVTSTSAVAGTTYVNNFPLTSFSNGVCASVSNTLGGSLGMIEASSNRIYVPAWTTATNPVNVIGIIEAA